MSPRERSRPFARRVGRALTLVLLLLCASAMRPAGAARAQWIQFSQVPPNPSGTASAPVTVTFGGWHGYHIEGDPFCEPVDDGPPCQGIYVWYDSYLTDYDFQFTVNGAAQPLSVSLSYDMCYESSVGRDCNIGFSATGTPTFPDGNVTLVAQSYCPDCGAWYSTSYGFTNDRAPPVVSLAPASGGTYTNKRLTVIATASDPSGLNAGSRTMTLRGAAQSQQNISWSASGTQATFSTTVTLVQGANTVTASVCDGFNNCSPPVSATYTYNPPPPTAQITVGTRTGASQAFRIDWWDNNELVETSRSLTWNGAAVPQSSFGFIPNDAAQDSRAYYSTISLPLQQGSNTLTATICNTDQVCVTPPTTRSVSYDGTSPTITLTPNGGYFNVPNVAVSIAYCDETSLSALSQLIELTPVTTPDPKRTYPNPFGYTVVSRAGCVAAANAGGTVELSPGHNTFHAHIADNGGNPADRATDLIYDATLPAVAVSPTSGATVGGRTLADTITWSDNEALNATSATVTMNGVAVATMPYTSLSGKTGKSMGRVPLVGGLDTLVARICDQAGNCQSSTAIYTVPFAVTVTAPPTNTVEPFAVTTQSFSVRNTGLSSATFNLAAGCDLEVVASCSAPLTVTIDSGVTATVPVTVRTRFGGPTPTHIYLTAKAGTGTSLQVSVTADLSLVVKSYAVALSPRAAAKTLLPGGSSSQAFTVTNVGTVPASYAFRVDCPATVTSCTTPAPTPLLDVNASTSVSVSFTAGAHATRGRIALVAGYAPDSAGGDSAYVDVISRDPAKTWVVVNELNSGTAVERDLCLTMPAGPGAAYECGDLRLVHALPTTRTLGVSRTPTLVYNSAAAAPIVRIAADVTWGTAEATPDSVRGCANFAGGVHWCGAWPGSAFTSTAARRITVRIDGSGLPISTRQYASLHAYTFVVTGYFGAAGPRTLGSSPGELIMVDRRNSLFGRGWALAGLEQIFFLAGNRILWLGGDGSSRVYEPAGTNLWRAPTLDRVDVLTLAGGTYNRELPNNLRVQFNSLGRHIATINRLNRITYFRYDAATGDTLKRIRIPMPSATDSLYYAFDYSTPGKVIVTAPPAGSTVRQTTLTLNLGTLMSVKDPDGDSTRFGSSSGLVLVRTDKLEHAVSYAYDAPAQTLSTVTIPVGGTIPDIVTQIAAAEAVGTSRSTLVRADSVYTLVNGPRRDTTVTRFWVNQYGAPFKIRNALDEETLVERGDFRFPALATRLTAPNGFVTTAAYNGRGLLASTTAVSPYGDARNPVTSYTYSSRWDELKSITLPEGELTTFGLDWNTGFRIWQQDSRGTMSRVWFNYYNDTPRFGILQSIQPAGTTCDTANMRVCEFFIPDATGNLGTSIAATGFRKEYLQDAAGRTIRTRTQLDSAATKWRTDTVSYDRMGRDSVTRTVVDTDTLYVRNTFNKEGAPLAIARWVSHDYASLGVIADTMVYDWAGRMLLKADAFPDEWGQFHWDSLTYDPAGNVTRRVDRELKAVAMTYDPLNRLSTRIARQFGTSHTAAVTDTARFAYDVTGQLRQADNAAAKVHRSYFPGGALMLDTLQIARADLTFSGHAYGLAYAYDKNGRRTELTHPNNLLLTPTDKTRYAYDPAIGGLALVTDPASNAFGYDYDAQGRVWRSTTPGTSVVFTYDGVGQLKERKETATDGTLFHDDLYKYQAFEGKLSQVTTNPDDHPAAYSYTGFGAVYTSDGGDISEKRFDVDALGNVARNLRGTSESSAWQYTTYRPHSTRLWKMGETNGASRGRALDTLAHSYDRAGNLLTTTFYSMVDTAGIMVAGPLWNQTSFANTSNGYNAEGRLNWSERRTSEDVNKTDRRTLSTAGYSMLVAAPSLGRGVYEEYRYDALGRRVWVRSHRKKYCTNPTVNTECLGALQRTVWDGDQVLYEIRVPGDTGTATTTLESDAPTATLHFGVVGYTHGNELDAPVGLFRSGQPALALHRMWRGGIDEGTAMNGARLECSKNGSVGGCLRINWAESQTVSMARSWVDSGPPSWFGSLATQQRDATGQMYMRNRMYDPVSGRFTQEDPIGLAGGLNLYGFAGGDPVNFSDPFGLWPCPELCGAGAGGGAVAIGGAALEVTGAAVAAVGVPVVIAGGLALWASQPVNPTAIRQRSALAPGDVTATTLERRSGRSLKKEWEAINGESWPEGCVAHHICPLADGGADNGSNIQPKTPEDHVQGHKDNGDFKRWGARSKKEPPQEPQQQQ